MAMVADDQYHADDRSRPRKLGRVALTAAIAVPSAAVATGAVAAHAGGGMMDGGSGGLMGGGLLGGGLLWLFVLLAIPVAVYALTSSGRGRKQERHAGTTPSTDRPEAILRERYARGELSEEEYERRRDRLRRER